MIPKLEAFIKEPRYVLAFDPGETTGMSLFNGAELVDARQITTKIFSPALLRELDLIINDHRVHEIVIEDYRVYGWKTEEHSFAGLHTPKLIGYLICLCDMYYKKYTLRMAQPAKAFVTDEKLEAWDLWLKGHRHARDAMRHAIFQMIFPNKDISKADT